MLSSVQAAAEFGEPTLAALDHDGACRALPLTDPDECFANQAIRSSNIWSPHSEAQGDSEAFALSDSIQPVPGFTTMKESKAQKPSQSSTLSGVVSEILKQSSVTAGPSKSGIEKLDQLIQKALLASALSQDEAAHLAGKLNFVCS